MRDVVEPDNVNSDAEPHFRWSPGRGPTARALTNLRVRLSRLDSAAPARLAGPPLPDCTEKPVQDLTDEELSRCLADCAQELASGSSTMRPAWRVWVLQSLPELVMRSHGAGGSLLELLVTAFMSLYWEGLEEEYPGFQLDVLESLGFSLMKAELWGEVEAGSVIGRFKAGGRPSLEDDGLGYPGLLEGGAATASGRGPLSAMMFFCLKFVPPQHIEGWARSILEIPCPAWRAQLAAWLAGACPILRQVVVQYPAGPGRMDGTWPSIAWELSYLLPPENAQVTSILPIEQVSVFLSTLERRLGPSDLWAWWRPLADRPTLGPDLATGEVFRALSAELFT